MSIISISLNRKTIDDIEKIKTEMGYVGRSEVVRAGIRLLSEESNTKKELTGNIIGTISLVHDEQNEKDFVEVKHIFNNLIETQLHSKLGKNKCLELLIVKGDAEKIKDMIKELRSKKKIENVKLSVI